jgi:2-polyprenyl-6-methoxyphenol hydroxylase-like FAD-dependent oxidoreductase
MQLQLLMSKATGPRDEGIYVCYATPGKQVARFALRDDRTMFLFVFATDQAPQIDPGDDRLPKELLRARFNREEWECPMILSALDGCGDLYFDQVSQIRMNTWSLGRVALVGDAAFCPSLISGRGAALSMLAAYVLAGELSKRKERPEEAFRHYQRFLRYFIIEKQAGAEQLAVSFVPQTPFDLFLRNQFSKAFSISFIAKLAMGESVVDRLDLPEYPRSGTARA